MKFLIATSAMLLSSASAWAVSYDCGFLTNGPHAQITPHYYLATGPQGVQVVVESRGTSQPNQTVDLTQTAGGFDGSTWEGGGYTVTLSGLKAYLNHFQCTLTTKVD